MTEHGQDIVAFDQRGTSLAILPDGVLRVSGRAAARGVFDLSLDFAL
jgi:hypothetical protein